MGHRHDFAYYKVLNIFNGGELFETFDSWRCRGCGIVRLAVRRAGQREVLPDPQSPEKRWLILICRSGGLSVEAYPVEPGDIIEHECQRGKLKLPIGENFLPSREVEEHYFYLFDDVGGGYIDLFESPPRVVSPRRLR